MRRIFLKTVFLICVLLLSSTASAGWYTAQGSASISSGGVAQARNEAINDAVRNVLLQTGANVSVEQVFHNGVLTSNSMSLKGSAPIRKINVIEEQKTSNKVTVTVRVLIDDKGLKTCATSKVRKTVLPLSFRYVDQNAFQASAGIEDINRELDSLIYSKLSESPSLVVKPISRSNLKLSGYANSNIQEQRQVISNLARQNEAQYLISGTIQSVAPSDVGENVLSKLFYTRTRSISFRISVIDATTGFEIFNKSYEGEADWPFKQGEFVDLRSDRFRGSAYGERVKQLSDRAYQDVIQSLQCLNPSARVIDLEGDEFLINLGRSNGITKGMEFSLEQSYEGIDRQGNDYQAVEQSHGFYKVVEVYPHAARLRPASLQDNVLNVQLDDIVTLR
ncbi:MAG: flagellar assembly protein T N-terminal domain-containing protein [Succinivibrio sp.]|nr:flagellar assembly protein T N-terminal domain-containing protein [Succinivibrio sp.]